MKTSPAISISRKGTIALAFTMAVSLSATASPATDNNQHLVSVLRLPAELAQKAATAAVLACRKEGWQVAASVVNQDGVLQAVLRDNDAGPHTISTSYKKAYAAASLKVDTLKLDQEIQQSSDLQSLRMIDNTIILGGGVPIRKGKDLIAAIGVSGTPSTAVDVRCAEAGIDTIKAALQ